MSEAHKLSRRKLEKKKQGGQDRTKHRMNTTEKNQNLKSYFTGNVDLVLSGWNQK